MCRFLPFLYVQAYQALLLERTYKVPAFGVTNFLASYVQAYQALSLEHTYKVPAVAVMKIKNFQVKFLPNGRHFAIGGRWKILLPSYKKLVLSA